VAVALRRAGSAQAACDSQASEDTYYLPPLSSFGNATSLYSDSSGTAATGDYYSNGTVVRYWDGVSFTSNANCGNLNDEF
jgi:hypothetical protein